MVARTEVTGGSVTHALQGWAVMVRNQEQDQKKNQTHAGLSFTVLSDVEMRI